MGKISNEMLWSAHAIRMKSHADQEGQDLAKEWQIISALQYFSFSLSLTCIDTLSFFYFFLYPFFILLCSQSSKGI